MTQITHPQSAHPQSTHPQSNTPRSATSRSANRPSRDPQRADTDVAVEDPRPRFGIGHMGMSARDIPALVEFYRTIGMRIVVEMERFAILELRGGTHLILQPGRSGSTTLDLIVDDIDGTREVMAAAGAKPSRIVRGHPHDRFGAVDPEGNTLHVSSNHAIGPV